MNTKDPAQEEAELVMDMYDYALTHNLDIKSKDDVMKIMEVFNEENTDDERIERLMKALQITAQRIQSDITRRKKVN